MIRCLNAMPLNNNNNSDKNEMLYLDVSGPRTSATLSPTSSPTPVQHIPSDLPVRLDDSATPPLASPLTAPASAPPLRLGLSLGGSSSSAFYDDDEPLPIKVAVQAPPELRTWRITSAGLVSTMGAFLDKPKTAKDNLKGEGQGVRYAMASMQGWRVDMEDAHVVQVKMGEEAPFNTWSFFAVFDGHAGSIAAECAASNVTSTMLESEAFSKMKEVLAEQDGRLCDRSRPMLEEGLKSAFLDLDEKIRKRLDQAGGKDRSGTTAVCAILTPSHIVIANLGDSRAVFSRAGEDKFGTDDHKPCNEKERQRIINAGGSVMIQRINGSLAVSRALGDFEYKGNSALCASRQQVSPEPDIYFLERQESDEFLILACDGIYDVMSNEELCRFVESRLHVATNGLDKVCNEVLDACLSKGSRDNMTFLLVCFEGAPAIHDDKVKEEEKQMDAIKHALSEIVDESLASGEKPDEISVEYVLRTLTTTRPELIPEDPHVRLLTRSLAEAVIASRQDAAAAPNSAHNDADATSASIAAS